MRTEARTSALSPQSCSPTRPSALSPQHCVRTANSRPPDGLPWGRRSGIVVFSLHSPAPSRSPCGGSGADAVPWMGRVVERAETLSVAISVPFDRAWAFLTDPTRLHLWTVDFALAPPEPRGEYFRVQTQRGDLDLFIRADHAMGVIDFHFGRDGQFRCSPSRLLRTRDGVLYIFTQFEPPGAPLGQFETLVANVRKELTILKSLLESA